MPTEEDMARAAIYRQRAKQAIKQAQRTEDERGKRGLLELASVWIELAQRRLNPTGL
jgi:hypothetical protein